MANKRPSGIGGKADRTVPITATQRTGTVSAIYNRVFGPKGPPEESEDVVLEARLNSFHVFLQRGFPPDRARTKAKLDDAVWQELMQTPGFPERVEAEYQKGLSALMEASGRHIDSSPTFAQFWLKTQHGDVFEETQKVDVTSKGEAIMQADPEAILIAAEAIRRQRESSE